MNCPEHEYKDGGWTSWECYCQVTGELVGNQNDHARVDRFCMARYDTPFTECPLYKSKHD